MTRKVVSLMITIADFLTDQEILEAIRLGDRVKVRDEIIIPNIERINRDIGQENDPNFLAFAVEYVMTTAGHWKV